MSAITYDKIKIEGEIEFVHLYQMSAAVRGGRHACARIEGEITEGSMKNRHEAKGALMRIICYEEESNTYKPLFTGIIGCIRYKRINENPYAEIDLVSATKLLDGERRCRSFQKAGLTYREIAECVVKKNEGADCICTTGETAVGKPLIQYQETDWEFLIRLASCTKGEVYPDVKAGGPRVTIGFPNEAESIEIGDIDYSVGISGAYAESELPSGIFIYYEVELEKDYDIGTGAVYKGSRWRIERKRMELKQGIMVFTYRLRKGESIQTAKKYQRFFTGMSILGTVLSVEGEKLKLHLDIDEVQEEAEAYPYEWTPDTGSAMYCMPKAGTKATLYFPSRDEQRGRAIGCVRENGGTCPALSDPNKRGLTTEYGKSLVLNPEDMGLKSEANEMGMADGQGITIKAMKKVKVTSEKKIKLKGKKVRLTSPKELELKRR